MMEETKSTTNILIKVASLLLMLVSFIAFIAKAPAFPIASENLLPWSVWFLIAILVNMVVWGMVVKLMTYVLAIIWFFALIAAWVPDTSTVTATLTELDWEDPDGVVEFGEAIFKSKGQCSACHTLDTTAPKGRCPDLTDIGINAANREPGKDARTYLIESLYEPSKYLVPGYGKIMPEVWKNPIALTKIEIAAVIAFLESQGGEVNPTLFDEPIDRAEIGAAAEALPPLLTGDPEEGKRVFIDVACISCHEIQGLENPKAGEVNEDFEVVTAPELTEIAALNSMRYIEESILLPDKEIVPGYGTVTVLSKGVTYQGTLVSQDTEQIVVRTKADDGTETEHTILLSDLDEEPIEDLTDLKGRGYLTLTITPIDTDTPVSGEIVEESDTTVTLKVGDETQTVSKTDVKKQMTLHHYDENQTVVGELVSKDEFEIVLIVDGNEESFDTFDWNEDKSVLASAYGTRLEVKSPMPTNFPDLLSLREMADLIAYLSTLTGATEEETNEASSDTQEEVTE